MSETNMNLAVTRYEPTNGINGTNGYSINGHGDSPRDQIIHETLKHLIGEVQELRGRCTNLEAENADLKTNMQSLEQNISTNFERAPTVTAVNGNGNLTGYASSNSSSGGKPEVSVNKDIESLNQRVDKHVTTVNDILEKFHNYLMKEVETRTTLEKQVIEICRSFSFFKGRIGAFEASVKIMKNDIDEIEVAQNDQRLDSHFVHATKSSDGMTEYFQDKLEKVQGELNMALMDVRELHNDVKAQGTAVSELQIIVTANDKDTSTGWAVRQNGNFDTGDDGSAGTQSLKSSVDMLTATVQAMVKKAEQEQKIDDAATKDSLYIMYKQLNHDIYEGKRIGPFEGTSDELWALRDRVVRRLAVFDTYTAALQEARDADVDF